MLLIASTLSATTPTQENVAKLYVATFNRAPDTAGLDYWINSGNKLEEIASSFFDQDETLTLYPDSTSNRDFIFSVYQNLFNRTPDTAGWDYWENELNEKRFSKNLFILAVINGARDNDDGMDKTTLVNKTEVGLYFVDQNLSDTTKAKEVIDNVSSDYDSVNYAFNSILKILEDAKTTLPSQTDSFMDISKWDTYGTVQSDEATFTIGDNIGLDSNDIDSDNNYWNALADGSTQHDYDVMVSKQTFTPPLYLKFSGTISTTDLGYNEMGFAYKNENFTATIADGTPISTKLVEFVSRWEDPDILNFYVDKVGYINSADKGVSISAHDSYITGNFEIKWDGTIVTLFLNDKQLYTKALAYTQGKKVIIFFKNYERKFDLINIYAGTYTPTSSQDSDTTLIAGTTWVDKEPDGYYNYAEAKAYCEDLGYRLPTAKELEVAWNYYGAMPLPKGFQKDTFYWGSKGEWCAMDYDCSDIEIDTEIGESLDGSGHPKCILSTSTTGTNITSNDNNITFGGLIYGAVTSPMTNRIWLDRNLGATRVCTSTSDKTCYGDYYQWGRETDGHEKKTSATSTTQASDISNVGTNFIISSTYKWTSADVTAEQRYFKWKKSDGTSICPSGFRVPTSTELRVETTLASSPIKNNIDAFNSFLKLPTAGFRDCKTGNLLNEGTASAIWTNSVNNDNRDIAYDLYFQNDNAFVSKNYNSYGFGVRCIED